MPDRFRLNSGCSCVLAPQQPPSNTGSSATPVVSFLNSVAKPTYHQAVWFHTASAKIQAPFPTEPVHFDASPSCTISDLKSFNRSWTVAVWHALPINVRIPRCISGLALRSLRSSGDVPARGGFAVNEHRRGRRHASGVSEKSDRHRIVYQDLRTKPLEVF